MANTINVNELLARQNAEFISVYKQTSESISTLNTQLSTLNGALLTQGAFTKIPQFTAGDNFDDWIFEIEKTSKIHGLSDESTCSLAWDRCKGIVSKFIARRREESLDLTWSELKADLGKVFGQFVDKGHAFTQLTGIVQGKYEDIYSYIERMLRLVDLAYEKNLKSLDDELVQWQLITIFMEGLRSCELKRRIYKKNVKKLQEAINIVKEDELSKKRFPDSVPEEAKGIDRLRRTSSDSCYGGSQHSKDCREQLQEPKIGPLSHRKVNRLRRTSSDPYYVRPQHYRDCYRQLPEPKTDPIPSRKVRVVNNTEVWRRKDGKSLHDLDRRYRRCFYCHQQGHFWVKCRDRLN